LTAEAIRQYEASRAQLSSTSLLIVEDGSPAPLKIPGKKKFSLAAIGEGMSSALGFLRRRPDTKGQSAVLAKSKRRGTLLHGLMDDDPTSSIGNMDQVDAMLKRKDG
jgi:hypothetical protein